MQTIKKKLTKQPHKDMRTKTIFVQVTHYSIPMRVTTQHKSRQSTACNIIVVFRIQRNRRHVDDVLIHL